MAEIFIEVVGSVRSVRVTSEQHTRWGSMIDAYVDGTDVEWTYNGQGDNSVYSSSTGCTPTWETSDYTYTVRSTGVRDRLPKYFDRTEAFTCCIREEDTVTFNLYSYDGDKLAVEVKIDGGPYTVLLNKVGIITLQNFLNKHLPITE